MSRCLHSVLGRQLSLLRVKSRATLDHACLHPRSRLSAPKSSHAVAQCMVQFSSTSKQLLSDWHTASPLRRSSHVWQQRMLAWLRSRAPPPFVRLCAAGKMWVCFRLRQRTLVRSSAMRSPRTPVQSWCHPKRSAAVPFREPAHRGLRRPPVPTQAVPCVARFLPRCLLQCGVLVFR